jgi:hypothetical protein
MTLLSPSAADSEMEDTDTVDQAGGATRRPDRLVSGAVGRLMVFESVNDATRLWMKGREFTVGHLLGDAYKGPIGISVEPWVFFDSRPTINIISTLLLMACTVYVSPATHLLSILHLIARV